MENILNVEKIEFHLAQLWLSIHLYKPVVDSQSIGLVRVPLNLGLSIVGTVVQMDFELELCLGHVVLSHALVVSNLVILETEEFRFC